ncbi:STAS domain-containing protein [Streptomyces iconiensis]|uniref:STAS domain-containing protein n=1 Tax=Streptomyces iconiensis TaxID=1384038 RepID=A0ABT6ZRX7_9ACTN|nr:STAS domain-containing protein [Streptomyces iconiensis]MDJ1131813.1 STAS domain-containing protein [Streptomyces iconiensis]
MAAVSRTPTPPDREGFRLVRAGGELDIATLPPLESALSHALSSRTPPYVVVDLCAVTFADCATVRVLLHARAKAHAERGWLGLACAPRPIGRLLRTLDLMEVLPPHASVDEAIRACPALAEG